MSVPVSKGELALERSLLLAVVALRWATLAWATTVVVIDASNDSFAHLWAAIVLVGAISAFTIWTSVMVELRPSVLLSPASVIAELCVGAALVFFDHWAYGSEHSQSLGTAWPLAGIITAGIRWGGRGGFAAGFVLGCIRLLGELRFVPGTWSGDQKLAAVGTIVLYALGGGVAGFSAVKLREAERLISIARAREEMARTLHDGVLQTLAVIQRRSDDPELKALARAQDRELREFLFGRAGADGLEPALRAAAARFTELFDGAAEVVVVEPVDVGGEVAGAVVGAATEALNNAGKHGQARHATIFLDRTDEGWLFCTVKDDGRGFDPATTSDGVGLARSIRTRIEEVGGRVEVTARPGQGAEVRMWVPV